MKIEIRLRIARRSSALWRSETSAGSSCGGCAKVRYRGLAKNTQRIAVLLGLSNLLIAGRYAVA